MKLPAKKSLGQHFLSSSHVLSQIIEAAHLQQGEHVLEIGPGTGVLTQALLAAGAVVTAVEKDDRAWKLLENTFSSPITVKKLTVVHGDILTVALSMPESFALVANIPYYITGTILEKFLEHGPRPDRLILLVQREVAERIVARDGKESILSISVKAFGSPRLVSRVPRGAFTPPPTVESAILAIENVSDRRFRDAALDPTRFFQIVRAGFAHKRKLLSRNLETILDPAAISTLWDRLNLSKTVRAEDLPLDRWFEIAQSAKCA